MNRATIDGGELEYEVRGSGEPVVLVHGSHIADAFVPLLEEPALTDRYELIVYHRRGFAGSTHPDGALSIAEQAADCHALMRNLGLSSAHIVGHSYGGAIALQLALDTPEAVRSMALLEPALLLIVPSAQQFMEAMGPPFQLYESGDAAGAIDAFLQAVLGPEYRGILDRALPGAFDQATADIDTFFRIELPALQQWQFTQEDARRIAKPVMYVSGADSHTLWPGWVEVRDLVQGWLPQSETLVLDDTTHALQVMRPREVAEGLASFLARHPGAARS